MSAAKPIFFGYFGSSCTWRVRIALNLKKIDYEYKVINLLERANQDPSFVAINPTRKIPALIIDGKVLTESLAIIEFLDENYKTGPRLLPEDPFERATARAIALQVTAGIQPLQNKRITWKLDEEEKGKGAEFAQYFVNDGLKDLEALVKRSASKYCVGDTISIADLCIPSILYKAQGFNVDLSQFTTLNRINKNLADISEFKAAEPENQSDYPGYRF